MARRPRATGSTGPNPLVTPNKLKPYTKPGKPLGAALLEAIVDNFTERADELDALTLDGQVTPLPGGELPYQDWLAKYAGFATRHAMGTHHLRMWDWCEKLELGKHAPSLIECWARGLGKSSSAELVATRSGIRGSRRFVLYVCAAQADADKHVQTIASYLEACGVQRKLNQYGFSKGWSASKLRASNGFNVLAIGLDTAVRGVKFDSVRPDMIILDDIDSLDDSVDTVEKKVQTIRQTILPTLSPDGVVIFVQNRIHANSIMARTLSGDIDMLGDRISAPIIPAITGLQYEAREWEDGRTRHVITAGTPVWEGYPIEACQRFIDTYGIVPFLRECQHDVGVGGRLFPQFKATTREGDPWHVVDGFDIPNWWRVWASHDYGEGAPCASLLYASDEHANTYIIGEFYEAGHVSSSQAQHFLELCARFKLAWPSDPDKPEGKWALRLEALAFDYANTFPPQDVKERIGEYPVEVWWDRGIPAIRAVKDRKAGWRRVREDLADTCWEDGVMKPRLRIFRGACPNLVTQLETAMTDPKDPEELDPGFRQDHCFVAGTMVRTDRGDVPIEDIKIGDRVLTRQGYRAVLWSWRQERKRVRRVTFTGGELVGTGNHPVWVEGRGFVRLDTLRYNDTISVLNGDGVCQGAANTKQRLLCSTVLRLGDTPTAPGSQTAATTGRARSISATESNACIAKYGSTTTAPSPTGTMSTTLTKTPGTTISPTLNACPDSTTSLGMPGKKNTGRGRGVWRTPTATSRKHGTQAQKVLSGTGKTQSSAASAMKRPKRCAPIAGRFMSVNPGQMHNTAGTTASQPRAENPGSITLSARARYVARSISRISTDRPNLAGVRVLTNQELPHTETVYNLSVDITNEYFANGVLVRNCLDSLRYGLMYRKSASIEPRKESEWERYQREIEENGKEYQV